MTDDTCDLEEAAKLMKIHKRTLERMIADGKIPSGKIGRSVLLLRSDVLKYITTEINKQHQERLVALAKEREQQAVRPAGGRSTRGRRRASIPASLRSA